MPSQVRIVIPMLHLCRSVNQNHMRQLGQGSDIFRSQNSHVTDGALNHSLNGSDLPVFIAALDER